MTRPDYPSTWEQHLAWGHRVFPLQGKRPYPGSAGYKDATSDPAIAEQLFAGKSGCNVGWATGQGVLCIDVDGDRGIESLRKLECDNAPLPETWTVVTGGGGLHIFFRIPEDHPVSCSQSVLGPKIDVRADGGYVVAAGSTHPETGKEYDWEVGPGDAPLADAPDWLLRLLRRKNAPEPLAQGEECEEEAPSGYQRRAVLYFFERALEQVQKGHSRHEQAVAMMAQLRDNGVRQDVAAAVMDQFVKAVRQPGKRQFTAAEGERVVADIFKHRPRGKSEFLYKEWESLQKVLASQPERAKAVKGELDELRKAATEMLVRAKGIARQKKAESLGKQSLLDIMNMEEKEQRWLVDGLFPESGLGFLVGDPKVGKSWFVLELARAVAAGRPLSNYDRWRTSQSRVIYWALEDNPGRMQRRNRRLGASHNLGDVLIEFDGVTLNDAGLIEMGAFLLSQPSMRLAIVDTLARAQPQEEGPGNAYQRDYGFFGVLRAYFDLLGAFLVLVHHTRKGNGTVFDRISGSTALLGSCDSAIIMERTHGEGEANLHITGREANECIIAAKLEDGMWAILGDAVEHETHRRHGDIIDILRREEAPMRTKQIQMAIEEEHGTAPAKYTVSRALKRAVEDGAIIQVKRGVYRLA